MNQIYHHNLRLQIEHVDFKKRLRPSALMRLVQEACVSDVNDLGYGPEAILSNGLSWVLASERIVVSKMPRFNDEVDIITYAGANLHFFFPRYFEVRSKSGESLIKGSALWSIIDSNTRKLIDPKGRGVNLEGENIGGEVAPLLSIPKPTLDNVSRVNASYMLCDLNGHLNNSSYADLAFDLLPLDLLKEHELKELAICFKREIPLGSDFEIQHGLVNDAYYFANDNFTMKLVFNH